MELSVKTSATFMLSILSCSVVIAGAGVWKEINQRAMLEAMRGFNSQQVSINDVLMDKSFPIIIAENQRIRQFVEFNPLTYVQATDEQDGDVSSSVVAYEAVDEAVKGEYEVRYVVMNSFGLKSEKKIKVLVD